MNLPAGLSSRVADVTSYTGSTKVYGTLILAQGGSLTASSNVSLKAAGANFDVSGAGQGHAVVSINELTGVAGSTVNLGSATLMLNETIAASYSGAIQDGGASGGVGGGIAVYGSQPLTLAGTATYTGSTKVYGQLDLGAGGSIADSSNVSLKQAGAIFDVSGAGQGHGAVMINELTGVAASTINLGSAALSVDETTAASFSGVIADGGGAGSLTVGGSAYLTLAGANTYTGATTITGYLAIGAGGSIAASSQVVDNGFLMLGQNVTVDNLSGSGVVKMVANTLIDDVTRAATSFTGVIHGAGVLAVDGSTTSTTTTVLTLSGASDYSGGTTLGGGTLELSSLHAAGSGSITLSDLNPSMNAVLQIDNAALIGAGTATESFANQITVGSNDIIDLRGLSYMPSTSSLTYANGHVIISEGGVSVSLTIAGVDSAAAAAQLHVYEDGYSGTYITMNGSVQNDATHYHP